MCVCVRFSFVFAFSCLLLIWKRFSKLFINTGRGCKVACNERTCSVYGTISMLLSSFCARYEMNGYIMLTNKHRHTDNISYIVFNEYKYTYIHICMFVAISVHLWIFFFSIVLRWLVISLQLGYSHTVYCIRTFFLLKTFNGFSIRFIWHY